MKLIFLLFPILTAAYTLTPHAGSLGSLSRRGVGSSKSKGSNSSPPARSEPKPPTIPESRSPTHSEPRNPKLDNARIKLKATGDNSAVRLAHTVPELKVKRPPGEPEPKRRPGDTAYDPRRGFRLWKQSSAGSPQSIDERSRRPVAGEVFNGKGSIRGGNVRADVRGPSVVSVKDPSEDHGGSRLENVPYGSSKVFHASSGNGSKEAKIKVQGTAQLHGHDSDWGRSYLNRIGTHTPDTSQLEPPQESLI